MAERWRRPVIPLEIEQQPTQVIDLSDGRQLGDATLILRKEDIERMRLGYVCIKCLEPFERAWPKHCPVCGSPVRTEQAAYFAREYESKSVHLGPTTTLEEERAGLEERRRKAEEEERRKSNGS